MGRGELMIAVADARPTIEEFLKICVQVRIDRDLYKTLFEVDTTLIELFQKLAPLCFGDLRRIFVEHLFLQFCKVTDPAGAGSRTNLTTNYIMQEIEWPDDIRKKLQPINDDLMRFRKLVEPARSKRIAHMDLTAQMQQLESLGKFSVGADWKFIEDLEQFVSIGFKHVTGFSPGLPAAMGHDTYQFIRALEKSVLYDRCLKCTENERIISLLDYEGR
jgi:hypothetical protein